MEYDHACVCSPALPVLLITPLPVTSVGLPMDVMTLHDCEIVFVVPPPLALVTVAPPDSLDVCVVPADVLALFE